MIRFVFKEFTHIDLFLYFINNYIMYNSTIKSVQFNTDNTILAVYMVDVP